MSICKDCKHSKETKQGKRLLYWCSRFKGFFNSNKNSCDKYENKEK